MGEAASPLRSTSTPAVVSYSPVALGAVIRGSGCGAGDRGAGRLVVLQQGQGHPGSVLSCSMQTAAKIGTSIQTGRKKRDPV